MTRNEFMTALRRRLNHLPPEEQDAALKYYEEYFDEAASEEDAASQLGSPDLIADRILADLGASAAQAAPQKPRRSAGFWVLIAVLCVFASPILLSLAAAGVSMALTVALLAVAAVLGTVLPFLALTGALLYACVMLLIGSGPALGAWAPAGLTMLGAGLACGGLGLLCGVFTGCLCYWVGLLFKTLFASVKRRKGAKAQ